MSVERTESCKVNICIHGFWLRYAAGASYSSGEYGFPAYISDKIKALASRQTWDTLMSEPMWSHHRLKTTGHSQMAAPRWPLPKSTRFEGISDQCHFIAVIIYFISITDSAKELNIQLPPAFGSASAVARILRRAPGPPLRVGQITSAAFSRDSRILAASARDKAHMQPQFRLWPINVSSITTYLEHSPAFSSRGTCPEPGLTTDFLHHFLWTADLRRQPSPTPRSIPVFEGNLGTGLLLPFMSGNSLCWGVFHNSPDVLKATFAFNSIELLDLLKATGLINLPYAGKDICI